MKLSGKSAIVTGAGKGIGRGIAVELAVNGAQVCVVDILEPAIENTVTDLRSMSEKSMGVRADVSKDNEVKEMVSKVLNEFRKIDILANCAGVIRFEKAIETTEEDWDFTMEVNAKGVFLCCKAVAPHMIRHNYGKIVNIASQCGKKAPPFLSAYSASKGAVISFTQGLALELAPHGINVNAICPGNIFTNMNQVACEYEGGRRGVSTEQARADVISSIPLGRIGKPEEVAKLAVFFASEDSDYITGQAYNIGGGCQIP